MIVFAKDEFGCWSAVRNDRSCCVGTKSVGKSWLSYFNSTKARRAVLQTRRCSDLVLRAEVSRGQGRSE